MRKAVATLVLVLGMIPATAAVAGANEVAETNATEKVECLFRVYVTEGGEQGLECLV